MSRLAPSQPEAFPAIDLSAAEIVIPNGTPELLAAGFNSSAWKTGSQVLKVTKQGKDPVAAMHLLETMRREDDTLRGFIGDFMPETEYILALQTEGTQAHVVTVQPFVEGVGLPDFLGRPDAQTDPLQEFLAKSKEVFRNVKLMPDIACIEDGFDVFRSSNILIREDKEAKPELVDTTFGKTQRSASLGWLWTRLIYGKTVLAHRTLEKQA